MRYRFQRDHVLPALLVCLIASACESSADEEHDDAGSQTPARDAGGDASTGAEDASTRDASDEPALSFGDIPASLAQTGLYAQGLSGALADGVVAFEPVFSQWVDGGQKKRWLLLPEGASIDTRDMDDWEFPVGTKAWEEISRADKRIETRYITRYGVEEDEWTMVSYRWEGDDAVSVIDGISDGDDSIPSSKHCHTCHEGRGSRLLGVSAIQLSHDAGELNLATLVADGKLSEPPTGSFVLPGDAEQQALLGYLHVNCGSCHNPKGDPFIKESITMEHWQRVDMLESVEQTTSYLTSVDVSASTEPTRKRIVSGAADESLIVERMSLRGEKLQMPPIGSTVVDTTGLALVSAWIESLTPDDSDAGAP